MKQKNFFEGWYFKLQSEEATLAFIPEISYGENGKKIGSLQVVFPSRAYYFASEYPVKLKNLLYVVLGKNVFTDVCVHLNLKLEDLEIKGEVNFEDVGGRFNVMGPLNLFPLPCKHDIISMEQSLSGTLVINGQEFSFDGGKGYIEKDMGRSFPKRYMWSQCNDFDGESCRIVCAAAEIPIFGRTIMGTFACIEYRGKKLKLATYLGAKIIECNEEGFKIAQRGFVLTGRRKGGSAVELKSPVEGQMAGITKEYLQCPMDYKLEKHGREIFNLQSQRGSYEFL